ncbi:MAG: hypothetical protein U0930_22750 [Pirellulales bacterium]
MNIHEATELAKAIEGNGQYAVIAIGRFVMTDELSALSKQQLPWGVSVVWLADRSDKTVIHSEAEWIDYAKSHQRELAAKTAPKLDSKPAKLNRVEEEQLQLF